MSKPQPSRLVFSVFHLTGNSPESESAFAHALAVAVVRGSKLTLLHAGNGGVSAGEGWERFPHVRATLERWGLLEPGSTRSDVADKLSMHVKKVDLGKSSGASAVLDYLTDSPSELIVTGYDPKRGLSGVTRDATAEDLARRSGAMTLFIPNGGRGFVNPETGTLSLKRILIPITEEPAPHFSVQAARRIADSLGDTPVEVTLLHVGEAPPQVDATSDDVITTRFDSRSGDVVDGIIAAAEETNTDLIAMVTNGRNSFGEMMRGSHTERVVRRAACPVLSLPEAWSNLL